MDSKDSQAKKRYAIIPPSIRMAFIKKVLSKQATIKQASQEFGIKFSTSKAILQTYRREGRVGKKKTRQRRSLPSLEKPLQSEAVPACEPQIQTVELSKKVEEIPKPQPLNTPLQPNSQLLYQQLQQHQAYLQMNLMLNQFYSQVQPQTMTPSVVDCMRELERQRQINAQLWQMIELNNKQRPKQFGLISDHVQYPTPLQSAQQLDQYKVESRSTLKDLN